MQKLFFQCFNDVHRQSVPLIALSILIRMSGLLGKSSWINVCWCYSQDEKLKLSGLNKTQSPFCLIWIKLPSDLSCSTSLCIWADAWYLYVGSIPSTDPSFFQFDCCSSGTQTSTSQAIRGIIIACSFGQHKDMSTMSWIWSKSVHVLCFTSLYVQIWWVFANSWTC